jgi:hypothetical protein
MTPWEKINQVFDDADKIKKLQALYMERGNVTSKEALEWALEQFREKNKCK